LGGDALEVVSPFQKGTIAGRYLERIGGDGGYMVIMQTEDAAERKNYILQNKLAKVITDAQHDDGTIVQYHPKGIKGGVIPELDSHQSSDVWPNPVITEFSPWIPLGPKARTSLYLACMRQSNYIRLIGVILRLQSSDTDTEGAAKQWEETFGVNRRNDLLCFTNARLGFVAGAKGEREGIHSITLAVHGKERLERMLWAANEEGLCGDGWVNMLGVRWYFREATEIAT
jgi:hypothetical protein